MLYFRHSALGKLQLSQVFYFRLSFKATLGRWYLIGPELQQTSIGLFPPPVNRRSVLLQLRSILDRSFKLYKSLVGPQAYFILSSSRSDQLSRPLLRSDLFTRVYLHPPEFHSRSGCVRPAFNQLRSNLDRFELRPDTIRSDLYLAPIHLDRL